MKPKLLIIITRANIGGAQNYVLSLAKSLKFDYEILVAVGSSGYLTDALGAENINFKIINGIDDYRSPLAIIKIRKLIKDLNPAIINCHSTVASICARVAAIGTSSPVVYSVHGWVFAGQNRFLRKILGGLAEWFMSGLTTAWITETVYDQHLGIKNRAITSKDLCHVVPNGVSVNSSAKATSYRNARIKLVFVGRISHQKNPELAVEVISNLPLKYHLTIYCDNANDAKLLHKIATLNLGERITLIDDEENTSSVMEQYDVMLVTSRYEGMPLAIIEAMAHGLPIVSSDVCGLSELVIDGRNGFVVPEKSAALFAEKIQELTTNLKLYNQMSEESLSRFSGHHTLQVMIKGVDDVFKRVAEFAD